jgi:MSHA biogenesis protein MshJ
MKQWWLKQSVRINALSLRERVFLFLSLIATCIALADVLILTPAQEAQNRIRQKTAAQEVELVRLRAEVRAGAQVEDVNKSARDALAQMALETETVNQEILGLAPSSNGGPGLEQVLVQFLRRQEGLTLLSTNTLKPEVGTVAALVATAGAVVAPAGLPLGLTRQGLELRVSGPYAGLVRYVKALEGALPTLRWGNMQLRSEKDKQPELTLQVYVVGVSP